jgi:hypothetical protein
MHLSLVVRWASKKVLEKKVFRVQNPIHQYYVSFMLAQEAPVAAVRNVAYPGRYNNDININNNNNNNNNNNVRTVPNRRCIPTCLILNGSKRIRMTKEMLPYS